LKAPHSRQIVDGYLARLDRELRHRAIPERAELLSQVESHIAEARATLRNETDADLLNIIDRLGPPEVVAEGSSDGRRGARPELPQRQTLVAAARVPGLLILVWPVGVIALLYSGAWARIERVAVAGLAVLGPALVAPYLWTHGLNPFGRLAGFFWNPATITCLVAAVILVWRTNFGSGLHTRTRSLLALALCLIWLALVSAVRFLPY
jgi:uncharacterized membrane protein